MISLSEYVLLNDLYKNICLEYATNNLYNINEVHGVFPNCRKISEKLTKIIKEKLDKKIYQFYFTIIDCPELFTNKIKIILALSNRITGATGFSERDIKDKDKIKTLLKPDKIEIYLNSFTDYNENSLEGMLAHELSHFFIFQIFYNKKIDINEIIKKSGYEKYSRNISLTADNIDDILYFSDKNEISAYIPQVDIFIKHGKFNDPKEAFEEIMKLPLCALMIKIKDNINKSKENKEYINVCRQYIDECKDKSDEQIWKFLQERVNDSFEKFRRSIAKLCYDEFFKSENSDYLLRENLLVF